jgi:hypothetical protein
VFVRRTPAVRSNVPPRACPRTRNAPPTRIAAAVDADRMGRVGSVAFSTDASRRLRFDSGAATNSDEWGRRELRGLNSLRPEWHLLGRKPQASSSQRKLGSSLISCGHAAMVKMDSSFRWNDGETCGLAP